jgi:hypothetical protein
MSRRTLAALLLAACAALVSCNADVTEGCLGGPCADAGMNGDGGADACPVVVQTGDFPCDVFAVIHANCNPCHQSPPRHMAPFPLLTYADTQHLFLPGRLIFQQMYDQTRPTASPRMPLNGSLSAADDATLTNWLLQCAPPVPAGTGCGCITDDAGPGCD